MADYSKLTYGDMADLVASLKREVKRRNPLFCNYYVQQLASVVGNLRHMEQRKMENPGFDEESK